ncbi:hypothetical protein JK358_28440 [Nocardia sp. 2]|uniref:Uncharacterized protein n=1 Tax=Nocardia acididurans TaxID=2802282 RepID=A0ABS1MCH6_9NOCA|nr:hypothetical protein [Nocardia acididurans]MBL1078342.1 hypothetical protein [Nocardia acididurans]
MRIRQAMAGALVAGALIAPALAAPAATADPAPATGTTAVADGQTSGSVSLGGLVCMFHWALVIGGSSNQPPATCRTPIG